MKFVEFLQEYDIPFCREGAHHHCRTGWIQIDCPFCGKNSHKWHMGYSLSGRFCSCWRCGFHPLVEVLSELTGLSFRQVYRQIEDILPERALVKKTKGKLIIPKGVSTLQSPHKKYLRGRNFNWRRIEKQWEIGGVGIASKIAWSIFIPIHYRGEVVSWTSRSLSDKGARYISASESEESLPHKSLLYGEDFATHSIIVVEGPTDVWRIGCGAVATLGVGYSPAQVSKILKYPRRAVCFDKGAQKRAKKLVDTLCLYPGETYNMVLEADDPGSAGQKEIKQIREFLK